MTFPLRSGLIFLSLGIILGTAIGYFTQKNADQLEEEPRINGEARQLLFAAVIDNAPEARPPFGIAEADFVIETLAEGPATRLLAFFTDQPVEKIGPVRSARPYFLDWTLGFGVVPLAHSGGSKEALEEISRNPLVKDINEFFNEKYFWRDKTRPGPHNLFTSTKLMKELIERKGWVGSSSSFPRKRESSPPIGAEGEPGSQVKPGMTTEIVVNFSAPNFAVGYRYNQELNSYQRFLAGEAQNIQAKNIAVLHTTSRIIDEQLLTIDLETSGSGKAVIFRDGEVLQARWRKQGKTAPLQLLDADGSQVALNPGQTWIEVLDQRGRASWK